MNLILALWVWSAAPGWAEGTDDTGFGQRLRPSTLLSVDIIDAGEAIQWFGEIQPSTGDLFPISVEVTGPSGAVLGTWESPATIPTTDGTGTYHLDPIGVDAYGPPADGGGADDSGPPDGSIDPIDAWDVNVLGAAAGQGRVWSRKWRFDADSFTEIDALDGAFFVRVPGGSAGLDGVVEFAVLGLAGNDYDVIANAEGTTNGDLTGGGRSRSLGVWDLEPEYAIYLNPPEASSYAYLFPGDVTASTEAMLDCGQVMPGTPSLTLSFDADVEGRWHLVCDADGDGAFDPAGVVDPMASGDASVGTNVVLWDGLTDDGSPFIAGTYDCELRVLVGEIHMVAADIETAFEGIRLFEVDSDAVRTGLPMFWNDQLVQDAAVAMPDGQIGLETSGPNGVDAGAASAAFSPNVNARSWGAFSRESKGEQTYLDTWTWLADARTVPFEISFADSVTDGDGDGLSDGEEICLIGSSPSIADEDGDGLSDGEEVAVGSDPFNPDTDGDGWTDGEEAPDPSNPLDTDGDGAPNAVDPDDDGDGIPTAEEPSGDPDGDGIPGQLDADDDNDRVPTRDEDPNGDGDPRNDDTDGDGTPNYLDTDDDNDGLLTTTEAAPGGVPLDLDTDEDGRPNHIEADDDGDGIPTAEEGSGDWDGDGQVDALDRDDDNDSVFTQFEDPDGDGDPRNDDTDGDGQPNYRDTDDDSDGLLTEEEDADGDGDPVNDDQDDDGIPDYLEIDDDGDGVPTPEEDANGSGDPRDDDFDGDGVPDYLDPDDDNDGVDSLYESGDTDGDGTPDRFDTDDDNDGIPTIEEDVDGDGDILEHDQDGDGLPNYVDSDDDNDGIDTSVEGRADTDSDGTPDYLDTDSDDDLFGDDIEGANDSDGDGLPDYRDPDDDNDTLPSSLESPLDHDDDGRPDRIDPDDDGDGIPTQTEVSDAETYGDDPDEDGIPSWIDLDSDGDGILDAAERGDEDQDGVPDYLDPSRAEAWLEGGCAGCTSGTGSGSTTWWVWALALALAGRRRTAQHA